MTISTQSNIKGRGREKQQLRVQRRYEPRREVVSKCCPSVKYECKRSNSRTQAPGCQRAINDLVEVYGQKHKGTCAKDF
jgi:hypothetical protein